MHNRDFNPFRNSLPASFIPQTTGSGYVKKRRERKGKDQIIGRNYICGCGKSYLSYAALYTHSKTKHDGVFPAGTTTLKNRKIRKPQINGTSNENVDIKQCQKFNQTFMMFLDMVPGASRLSAEDSFNPVQDFPIEIFNSESEYGRLLEKLGVIHKEFTKAYGEDYQKQFEWILLEISMCQGLKCYEVFSLFLLYLHRFVSKDFFGELIFLIVSYAKMLNVRGWNKYKELMTNYKPNKNRNFCQTQNPEIVPDMSNYFMINFFPKIMETDEILKNPEHLTFFGNDSIKILRVILVIMYFSNWLNIFRFSNAKIEISNH